MASTGSRIGLRRAGFIVAVMSLVFLDDLVMARPVANADATGCTPAPRGSICFSVRGDKLHVDRWRVHRTKFGPDFVCDYSAQVQVRPPVNDRYFWGERKSDGGCSAQQQAYFDWKVDASFDSGTQICGFWWEGGKRTGGQPCVEIHS